MKTPTDVMRACALGGFAVAFIFGCATPVLDAQPAEAIDLVQRNLQRLQSMQASGAIPGGMSGLWSIDGSAQKPNAIWQFGDVYLVYIVDMETGELSLGGVAELMNGVWRGWFQTVCTGCCPKHRWWKPGVVDPPNQNGPLVFRIAGKVIDRDRCVETSTDLNIRVSARRVTTLRFKEIVPGKILHIVAVPAVGSQAAQYKASVTVRWDFAGIPIADIQLVVLNPDGGGSELVPKSRQQRGEYEFLTSRSGKYIFLLTAFNAKSQPLDFEVLSVDIPAIPGIGR